MLELWANTGSKYKKMRQLDNLELLNYFADQFDKPVISKGLESLTKELRSEFSK